MQIRLGKSADDARADLMATGRKPLAMQRELLCIRCVGGEPGREVFGVVGVELPLHDGGG